MFIVVAVVTVLRGWCLPYAAQLRRRIHANSKKIDQQLHHPNIDNKQLMHFKNQVEYSCNFIKDLHLLKIGRFLLYWQHTSGISKYTTHVCPCFFYYPFSSKSVFAIDLKLICPSISHPRRPWTNDKTMVHFGQKVECRTQQQVSVGLGAEMRGFSGPFLV